MAKKVSAGWRTAAIILGVLLLLLVSMTAYGFTIAGAETKCVDYCYLNGYESFAYDYSNDKCDCYIGTRVAETISIRG